MRKTATPLEVALAAIRFVGAETDRCNKAGVDMAPHAEDLVKVVNKFVYGAMLERLRRLSPRVGA
jgi:hypothetical protein